MENITDIIQIKQAVLKAAAEHAFQQTLYRDYDKIPYELIKGIKPNFRCCVYREREIIRQRVRLAMGKLPIDVEYTDKDSAQIVHVIPCACEGCPINQITVTENCQNCLAKKCVKACPFGAMTATSKGSVIDQSKCKKCGKCVTACPYHAIVQIDRPCKMSCPVKAISLDSNDIATIDPKKCINCGACVVGCPFGAISDVSMLTNVIDAISQKKKVYAMVAPSIEGQFGDCSLGQIKQAIRELGFADTYEVAFGADMVAATEAGELVERKAAGEKMTSSCCPAFVNLIEKHLPAMRPLVSTTVSPMIAMERYLRTKEPDAVTVFIGPCIAKKNEALNHYVSELDFVLTYEELFAMLNAKNIQVEDMPTEDEDATRYGKGFAVSGGVSKAVEQVLSEKGLTEPVAIHQCSGVDECRKALLLLKAGKLSADFVEGMACIGGCMGGPANLTEIRLSKKVFDTRLNGKENILENVKEHAAESTPLHTH